MKTTTEPLEGSLRRCWRCLQFFSCTSEEAAVGGRDWWLCDQCDAKLLGSNADHAGRT